MIPEILAPAGDKDSFLASLSAGADAIYLGLKHFSARMKAENFGLEELARLVDLAHNDNKRVYIAMNVLIKPNELIKAHKLIVCLEKLVHADALIIQDPALLSLSREAGFSGGLFCSTLANITSPLGLVAAQKLGANRVILPRELSIDEIRILGENCPQNLELECFVHGALCYCISGRCYWSSYLGGKSGLRGRCVQPCRRQYTISTAKHLNQSKKSLSTKNTGIQGRFFSCLDLSIDVLAKTLLTIPNLSCWKIEGRKKGAHYVYHVVTAYKILRDNPNNSKAKKMAEEILQMALGREPTKAKFLPQKNNSPLTKNNETSSGLLIGKIQFDKNGKFSLKPRIPLLQKDFLRIGVEDEKWHTTIAVKKPVPKNGTLVFILPNDKKPKIGTPVFLIDRKEKELIEKIAKQDKKLNLIPIRNVKYVESNPKMPKALTNDKKRKLPNIVLKAKIPIGKETRASKNHYIGLWLTAKSSTISKTMLKRISFWLPPILWPEEENNFYRIINNILRNGACNFVLNAPWQRTLFPEKLTENISLIAGPFCNLANAKSINLMKDMGFNSVIASPELNKEDFFLLSKTSPLPLGIVIKGNWPVGISRFNPLHIHTDNILTSPKNEQFFIRSYAGNTWIYPTWALDLTEKKDELLKMGYSFFVEIEENIPNNITINNRESLFNWNGNLL